ncbi:MAG: hypothetical protein IPH35_08745 [Rhodoferax sp.]|nr:hypothetical protein [Rhodoferax sp.]
MLFNKVLVDDIAKLAQFEVFVAQFIKLRQIYSQTDAVIDELRHNWRMLSVGVTTWGSTPEPPRNLSIAYQNTELKACKGFQAAE